MNIIQLNFRWAFVVALCGSSLVSLQSFAEAAESGGSITQKEYQQMIVDTHPNFTKEALNNELAGQDLQIQKAGQEWELQLNAQQAHQEELLPSFGPEKTDQSLIGASVGRPIWATGAYISLDAEGTLAENEYTPSSTNQFPSPGETQSQQISLTLSQPLLKNFRGSQSRLAYDLSEYSARLTGIQVEEQQEQFLFTMMDEYLDWALLAEEKNINQQRFELSRRQAEEIRKRFQKNLVERIDWLRSKDSERMAEQQYLLSSSRFTAKSKALALLNNYPALENMYPEFSLYQFPELPDLYSLLEKSKSDARSIRMLDMQRSQLQRQVESGKNETRAELNLDLRTAYKEEDQQDFASGQPDDSDDGQDYSVGLVYKKKLGNKAAGGELKKNEIKLEQLALEKQYAQMELAANIKNLHIQLKDMEKILQLNKEMVSTAQQTTEEEQRVYRQGRSDLTNVISSRDQAQNAQLQYARNAINYHKLYLQLESLTDQLLKGEGE